jgi:hypothetical protein
MIDPTLSNLNREPVDTAGNRVPQRRASGLAGATPVRLFGRRVLQPSAWW